MALMPTLNTVMTDAYQANMYSLFTAWARIQQERGLTDQEMQNFIVMKFGEPLSEAYFQFLTEE